MKYLDSGLLPGGPLGAWPACRASRQLAGLDRSPGIPDEELGGSEAGIKVFLVFPRISVYFICIYKYLYVFLRFRQLFCTNVCNSLEIQTSQQGMFHKPYKNKCLAIPNLEMLTKPWKYLEIHTKYV